MSYLSGGRTIEIEFAPKTFDSGTAGVPAKVTISEGESKVCEIEYLELDYRASPPSTDRYVKTSDAAQLEVEKRLQSVYAAINAKDADSLPSRYDEGALREEVSSSVTRGRLKANAYRAVAMRDTRALEAALSSYREMLERESLGGDIYVYNVEAVVQLAFDFVGEDYAVELTGLLRETYDECATAELLQHLRRLVRQYRLGFALLACQALDSRQMDRRARDAVRAVEEWLMKTASGGQMDFKRPDFPYADFYQRSSKAISQHLLSDAQVNDHKEKGR